jgi:DNA phosphorothioation-associated putative methyltransferase
LRLALLDGLILPESTVFDFGCGHGDDVRILEAQGISARGWDPFHRPGEDRLPADVVNLGYVLNVIEHPAERVDTARAAWALTTKVLIVAARTKCDAPLFLRDPFEDGHCTQRGTFQKFFEQEELRSWIDSTLGLRSIAAGPGVFYAFRDDQFREAVSAARFRRSPTTPTSRPSANELFRAHEEVLQPVVDFINSRGRLPDFAELENVESIVSGLGSFRRACAIVRRAIGEASWAEVELLRTEDLLVYLALSRFQSRPPFAALPRELQLDVRAFFGSYTRACLLGDEVLVSAGRMPLIRRACRLSKVGKLTPSALYLHMGALESAPPLLRVYEGCARSFVGTLEGANVVKLHHDAPAVSYLAYPRFETDPHPALATSMVAHLRDRRLDPRDYRTSLNPPILHRKERFVADTHKLWSRFQRLTAAEERAGLFENVDIIGTREGWSRVLRERGVRIVGHRVVRTNRTSAT